MSDFNVCLYGAPVDVIEVLEAPVTRTGEEMNRLTQAAVVNVLRRLVAMERGNVCGAPQGDGEMSDGEAS